MTAYLLPPPPAANAFLKQQVGPGYSARLVGVKDMPRVASRLSLDFSSLLGPLFSMWLLQVGTCRLPITPSLSGAGACALHWPGMWYAWDAAQWLLQQHGGT